MYSVQLHYVTNAHTQMYSIYRCECGMKLNFVMSSSYVCYTCEQKSKAENKKYAFIHRAELFNEKKSIRYVAQPANDFVVKDRKNELDSISILTLSLF